jgi:hypothetical protein
MDKKRFLKIGIEEHLESETQIMRPALSTKWDGWCAHGAQFELKSANTASRLALALLIRIMPARAFVTFLEKPCNLTRRYAPQDVLRQWPLHHLRPTEKLAQ